VPSFRWDGHGRRARQTKLQLDEQTSKTQEEHAARDKADIKSKREADDEQMKQRSKLGYDCDEAMVQGTLVSAWRVPSNVLTPLSPMAKQDFIHTKSPHASTQSRGTDVVHVHIMAVQKRFDKVLYVESTIRLGAFKTALRVKRQTRGVWRGTVAI